MYLELKKYDFDIEAKEYDRAVMRQPAGFLSQPPIA
jgi:hypothetical protein